MIGKSEVPRWRYDFDCRHCDQVKYLNDGVRKGEYCMVMVTGKDPIHADDDRVVRCDCYQPLSDQICLFKEGGE